MEVLASGWINGGGDVVLNLVSITEWSAHSVRGSMDTMYKTVPALSGSLQAGSSEVGRETWK